MKTPTGSAALSLADRARLDRDYPEDAAARGLANLQANLRASTVAVYPVGSLLLLTYGAGTQVAQVTGHTKAGKPIVDRFVPRTGSHGENTWKAGSVSGVDFAKIVSLLPESDPRRALILEG